MRNDDEFFIFFSIFNFSFSILFEKVRRDEMRERFGLGKKRKKKRKWDGYEWVGRGSGRQGEEEDRSDLSVCLCFIFYSHLVRYIFTVISE